VKRVFGYEITQRTTGTPAAEKSLENHRDACHRENTSERLRGSLFKNSVVLCVTSVLEKNGNHFHNKKSLNKKVRRFA
jgi:hypothetical protein